jgi:6-phospho-3-hexuloisomerase
VTLGETVKAVLAELDGVLGQVDEAAVVALEQRILAARRIYVAGAGRSGLITRAFGMRLMHAGLAVHVVGDATTPSIGAGDLLVIGSGSGETGSLQGIARKARALGAEVALLTIVPQSTIGQLASPVVELRAPSPKAVEQPGGAPRARSIQVMGSLFEQSLLLLLDTVALRIAQARGEGPDQLFARHANLE